LEIAIIENKKGNQDDKREISNSECQTIQTCISEEYFHNILRRISSKKCPFKYFSKSYKTFIHDDLYLENFENKENNLFSKSLQYFAVDEKNNYLYTFWKKDKKGFHAFPSTSHMSCIYYTNRLAFRINNRFYLNFDIYRHAQDDKKLYYKIFINVNSDKNVDIFDDLNFVEKITQFLS